MDIKEECTFQVSEFTAGSMRFRVEEYIGAFSIQKLEGQVWVFQGNIIAKTPKEALSKFLQLYGP
jgi:hypothetical protein